MDETTLSPQKRVLFLITSSFPYGEFETFLETEYPYLDRHFDMVFIIHTEVANGISRINPRSEKVYFMPYLPTIKDKWKYFRFLWNRLALKEVFDIIYRQKVLPMPGILSAIAGSLTTGEKVHRKITDLISHYGLWHAALYAYSYWCNDAATGLALLKLSHPNIHCISRAHGYDLYVERSPYRYLPFRRLIFSTLDQVCFVSEHGKNYAVNKFGGFPSFQVAHLGVDGGKSKNNAKEGDCWKLISCSSVIPIKRVELIIESLALIGQHVIHWTHIGSGIDFQHAERLANHHLGKKKNIAFALKGQMRNQEILQLYANEHFDLFINASKYEGLPVSMMEAMAHGIPVLGPDVGGISEIITDQVNGILISEPVTVKTLKQAIQQFLNYPEQHRMKLSANARNTWYKRFRADLNYPGFVDSIVAP